MQKLGTEPSRVGSVRNEPKKVFSTPGIGSAPVTEGLLGIGNSTKTGARRMMAALKDKYDKAFQQK
jgi:hypothetical protein